MFAMYIFSNLYNHQTEIKFLPKRSTLSTIMIVLQHYAPETFKMLSLGLTLLKFGHFTATLILREITFWGIQRVQKC